MCWYGVVIDLCSPWYRPGSAFYKQLSSIASCSRVCNCFMQREKKKKKKKSFTLSFNEMRKNGNSLTYKGTLRIKALNVCDVR